MCVQTNLDANNARGERPQKYDHYLRGTLYCSCGAKLMIERPRDKTGDRYEYFTCSGRRRKTTHCTRSAILAERAEAEIERIYQRNSLSPTQAEHVRKVLNDVFDQLEGSSEDERKLLTAQRDKLEAERLKLVQAHYADAIPLDLLKSEQDRIRASLDQITTRLDNLTDTYAEARTGLDQLTELLADLYNKCEPAERRILNRALFTRITIDDDENATYTPEQTTASVLAHTTIDAPAHVTAETKLPRHQAGQVSIFSPYVDAGGLSPNTWERLERLSSVWEEARRVGTSEEPPVAEPDPGLVLNPTRRSRTPLTPEEVDAIRTARGDGQPAGTIAKRFRIHRGTVWEKARDHARSKPVMQARPDQSTPSRSRADG
nr:recombinase zinc beta ribbon domain-containing protein [Tessaracoccus timonensis]